MTRIYVAIGLLAAVMAALVVPTAAGIAPGLSHSQAKVSGPA